jgi:hypothetical protein
MDLSAITIGDATLSKRGAKTAPLLADGKPLVYMPAAYMPVVFQPSAYGAPSDANRVNLVVRSNDSVATELEELDQYLVATLVQESERLFGKQLSDASVRERYVPLLHQSDKYPATVKSKLTLSGQGATKLWDEEKRSRGQPECWTACQVRPRWHLKCLWFMGTSVGVTVEATDLLLTETSRECPL